MKWSAVIFGYVAAAVRPCVAWCVCDRHV